MRVSSLMKNTYAKGTALHPRLRTDKLFELPSGSICFDGILMEAIQRVEKEQLLDDDLWQLFVNQFRNNVDDADKGWRCEYWGKMMRGACFVYACTKNSELFNMMHRSIVALLETQDAQGRISSYSVEAEFDGWDIWGRKYVLLGLQYFFEICEEEDLKARMLQSMIRQADYIMDHIGPADDGKLEITESTTHWAGLNSSSLLEPIVRLYSLTNEVRFLAFAEYIISRGGTNKGNLFEMAYQGKLYPYQYPVTKAYEMMSCFEGLLEYYRVTQLEKWRVAVENFVRLVAESDITLIGCAGCTHELFDNSAMRQLDTTEEGVIQETCVTVTWMKLCYQMLCLTGKAIHAEHIEQSLYNALLGAINTRHMQTAGNPSCANSFLPQGLPFDSYSPILPGVRGRKVGGLKMMENNTYYGCCAAIGAAGLGLVGKMFVMESNGGIYVNLFMNGSATIETPNGQPLSLRIKSDYPADGKVSVALSLKKEEALAIFIRIPSWSKTTGVWINGEIAAAPQTDGYACLRRTWREGDRIELVLDMNVRQILPEDYGTSSQAAPFIAFCRGPLVLALDEELGYSVDRRIEPAICSNGAVKVKPASENRVDNLIACDLSLRDEAVVRLIDYSSAGKSWHPCYRMAAWLHR